MTYVSCTRYLSLLALFAACALAALAGPPTYTTGTYFGGSGDEELIGAAFAPDGTIVVVGNTTSSGAISGRTPTIIGTDGTVTSTAFIARYANDGRSILTYTRFGWGIVVADDIAVDSSGIYLVGRASAAFAPLIAGLGGLDTTPPASGKKPCIAKFSPAGTSLIDGTYLAGAESTTDRQGIDFFSDGDVAVTHTTTGNDNLSRLSTNLSTQRWTVSYGTRAGTCRIQAMAVSRTDNMVYVIGYGMGSTTNEPLKGPFAYQFASNGALQWLKSNGNFAAWNWSPREGDGRLNGLISDSTGKSVAVDSAGQPLFTAFADGGATVLGKDPNDWLLTCPNQDGDGWWGCSGATSIPMYGRMDKTTHQWTRSNAFTPRDAANKVAGGRIQDLCAMGNDYVLAVGWSPWCIKGINQWYVSSGGGFIYKSDLGAGGTVRRFVTTVPSVGGFNACARQSTTNRYAIVGYSSADGAPCPYGPQTTRGGAKDAFLVVMDDDPATAFDAPPSPGISAPAHNAAFNPGAAIAYTATASDNGTVTKVEFFIDQTKVGEDTSSPYNCTWSTTTKGTYNMRAVATDNGGSKACSVPRAVKVTWPPTVSITSPSNGATFPAPASIVINATAADSDGTISKVEFYNGSTKLGTDTSSPYSYTWSNVGVGTYSLTARAYDEMSVTTTSSPVSVTVQ